MKTERLRSLNPDLDIWDAYQTIHVLNARRLDEAWRGSHRGGSKRFAQHKMVCVKFRHHFIRLSAISSRAQRGLCHPGRCATARQFAFRVLHIPGRCRSSS